MFTVYSASTRSLPCGNSILEISGRIQTDEIFDRLLPKIPARFQQDSRLPPVLFTHLELDDIYTRVF